METEVDSFWMDKFETGFMIFAVVLTAILLYGFYKIMKHSFHSDSQPKK